ncbi:E3 ubiquitin-protein ligase TRIM39-like isoform X2 [Lissotriton helveticus]
MAAVDPILTLKEESSCPICLDYFDDPVITACGHNFCRSCLVLSWRDLESDFSCPQCLTVSAQKIILANRQLRNVVELAKQLNTKKEATKELLCEKHKESLKLFCQDDQKPICVVCDRSRDHRSHTVHPIEEAAQECRGKLLDWLIPLKENLQLILESKLKEDKAYKSTMDTQSVMDRCDKDNNRKPDIRYLVRESTLECFNTQHAYIKEKIKTIKEYFPKELEFSRFKGFKVPIIMDPDTAHPKLVVSKDWRYVRWTSNMRVLPYRSKRFSTICAVVGTQGFSSGRHYWEVELKDKGEMWAVGVMAESVNRKGEIVWTPQRGIWSIGANLLQYKAFEKSVIQLFPRDEPNKLGVYLDYEKGQVSMYNADTVEHLFLFSQYTFTEKLFPFFFLSAGADMSLV